MQRRNPFVTFLRGRRAIAVGGALLAVLLLAIAGRDALRAARPVLRWRFDPYANQLLVTAGPGSGPLRGWVWSRTAWAGSGTRVADHPRERVPLSPGKPFYMRAALKGPEPVAETIRFKVPPLPSFSERTTADAVVLASSQPLMGVSGIPSGDGAWTAADPSRLVLDRRLTAETLRLAVRSATGERTTWRVSVPALPEVPVVWFGSPRNNQVYLTIDDGWFPSAKLLRLMQTRHIPITAFLIQQAVAEHPAYWQAFVQAGGEVEDHTVSHPMLTSLSYTAAEQQWAGPMSAYPQWLHVPRPSFGRPPYGAVDAEVAAAAYAAGLKAIVMWDVVWTPGAGFKTWNGGPIQAGDIILLHWDPGVGQAVEALLPKLAEAHLHPALLTAGVQ